MRSARWTIGAVCALTLALATTGTVARAATIEVVAEFPAAGGDACEYIEAFSVPDDNPNSILIATRNLGTYCGGGTPASMWQLTLDPASGQAITLDMLQTLPGTQTVQWRLFEASDGTLFTGSGWCGARTPYYSTDSGLSWSAANLFLNSTYAYAEFNGEIYAGSGYPHSYVHRRVGSQTWAQVFHAPIPRAQVIAMKVFGDKMFVGTSGLYLWGAVNCESSAPVHMTSDGQTFVPTTGIPGCFNTWDFIVVQDQLLALVFAHEDMNDTQLYRWDDSLEEWQEAGAFPFVIWPPRRPASDGRSLYEFGQLPGDQTEGVYRSRDLGQTWERLADYTGPVVWSMFLEHDLLYLGTAADSEQTVFAYRLDVNSPPVAVATSDDGYECTSPAGAEVALDGLASTDPDSIQGTNDDITVFDWFENYGAPDETFLGEGAILDAVLPLGTHGITLRTSDYFYEQDTAELDVSVVDTTAPTLEARLVPAYSRAAGLGMYRVDIFAADICDTDVTVEAGVRYSCGEERVRNGQRVRFSMNTGCKVRRVGNMIHVSAPALELYVTATDESGNRKIVQDWLGEPPEHRGIVVPTRSGRTFGRN